MRNNKLLGKVKTVMVTILVVCVLANITATPTKADAATLSQTRKNRAEKITNQLGTVKNWEKYGIYASVIIAQGIIESGLGEAAPAYNWWGMMGRTGSCYSLESGVETYCKLINTGWYGAAPHADSCYEQARLIASHGYCAGNHSAYYSKVAGAISKYGLKKFDKKMFKLIKKDKKRLLKIKQEKIRKKHEKVFKKMISKMKKKDSHITDNTILMYNHGKLTAIYADDNTNTVVKNMDPTDIEQDDILTLSLTPFSIFSYKPTKKEKKTINYFFKQQDKRFTRVILLNGFVNLSLIRI